MIKETLVGYFETSFKENWNLPAFTDYNDKTSYTYGEVAKKIAELHLLYDCCQIKQDSKIALIGRNTPNWCITALSVLTYGAVLVPILQDFNGADVQHIVYHSEAELFFCSDTIWDTLEEEALENVRSVFSLNDFRVLQHKDAKKYEEILKVLPALMQKKYKTGFTKESVSYTKPDNGKVALINYTSGTTGFSKGVMLTGNNLVGNVKFAIGQEIIEPRTAHLSFLPLAHAYGCAFDFLYPVSIGAHVTLLGRTPSPKILLKSLNEVRPAVVLMVPLIIEKLYKKQLLPMLSKPTLKLATKIPLINDQIYCRIRKKLLTLFGGNIKEIIIGGAALNQEVEDFLKKIKFPYTVGYGMTECGPLISYEHTDAFIEYSAGRVLKGFMEVRIDSEDPYQVVGEIQVRGENVMVGYFKNEEATRDAFTEDNWLKTGDLATIDEVGNIFIKGRSKNMILGANGQNIYPEELESKLNNMPFISESLIIERNGKLIALVYPDYELLDSSEHTQEDLAGIMEENLKAFNASEAAFKNISRIKLYPNEFEKTPKKSIKRFLYNSIVK
ncbi:MAG: AMP-binding protein [Candidatus Azobacteroides sp.]|nr:AMP-binding protein [Candidatus Azobacteroides sp.]